MSSQELNHDSTIARLMAICGERGVAVTVGEVIGETPYGQPFRADLVLRGIPDHPDLVVIARRQDSSGSAEQKLPFLVMAITRSRRPCLVVLDGPGWSEGALRWMRARRDDRVIDVVDVEGFDAFLAAALPPTLERRPE